MLLYKNKKLSASIKISQAQGQKFCKNFGRKCRDEGDEGRHGTVTYSQLINVKCVAGLLQQTMHIIEVHMQRYKLKKSNL